jgi:peptidoglycan/xylan/chitin deacetylase (PgdA/CDA1 family)
MTLPNLEVALHCWEHIDHSQMSYQEIKGIIEKSIEYFMSRRNGYTPKLIKLFCPPWNKSNPAMYKACFDLGLAVNDNVDGKTYNFHWWECVEDKGLKALEAKLK